MIAPLAKFIDWAAIQALTLLELNNNGQNPRLEEALQFLKGPDFIPADSQPAQLEFNPDKSGRHFRFPTPRPGNIAENNLVYGRLYRCGQRWQERPVIVLLHGRLDYFNHWFKFPLIARRCNRAGFNAATLVLPFQFQRRPRRLSDLRGPDYLRIAETTAQAVAEIRALTGWLLKQGCPAVALWGISYGAWLAGLTVCRDARLAAVVLTIPGVRMNPEFADPVVWRRIRKTLQGRRAALEALNRTALNLTTAQPAISKENILLIDAIHDLMVPKDVTKELWQAWGRPYLWRLPHGHISIICMTAPGLTGRVLRWLTPLLDAPAVRTGQTPH
jgi:pimeloyl-ACP methyl ester carboxylesterase